MLPRRVRMARQEVVIVPAAVPGVPREQAVLRARGTTGGWAYSRPGCGVKAGTEGRVQKAAGLGGFAMLEPLQPSLLNCTAS